MDCTKTALLGDALAVFGGGLARSALIMSRQERFRSCARSRTRYALCDDTPRPPPSAQVYETQTAGNTRPVVILLVVPNVEEASNAVNERNQKEQYDHPLRK